MQSILWSTWTWQFNFSTSTSNRCSSNLPIASLWARNSACSASSSGKSAAPLCSRDTLHSLIPLCENLQKFPVLIPKIQWPETVALVSPQQKPQNYPDGRTKDEEINFTDKFSNNASIYLSFEFSHQAKTSYLWPFLNEQPHQLFKAFLYLRKHFSPQSLFLSYLHLIQLPVKVTAQGVSDFCPHFSKRIRQKCNQWHRARCNHQCYSTHPLLWRIWRIRRIF